MKNSSGLKIEKNQYILYKMDSIRNSSNMFLNSSGGQNSKVIQEFIRRQTTGNFILRYDIPTTVILILIFLLGCGNLLVLYVLKRTKKLRNAFNIFVMGLALENILCSCIRVPMEIYEVFNRYEMRSKNWCQVKLLIGGFSNMATLSLVAFMAFVRMVIILQKVTVGISTKVAYFTVFISFSIGFGMAIVNINENNAQFAICVGDLHKTVSDRTNALEKKFLWTLQLAVSILFFAMTIISYTILIIYLIKKRAQRDLILKNDKKNNVMTIKTAFMITGIFFISYVGPYVPARVIGFHPSLKTVYHYNSLLVAVANIQSAANPLIYLYSSSVYRTALKETLPESVLMCWRRVFHGNQINEVTTTVQSSSVNTVQTTATTIHGAVTPIQPRRD